MDKKELPKVDCVTKEIWRNKKTGQIYEDEKEARFDLTAHPGDIVKDVTVEVTNKGLEVLNKIMNEK